MSYQTEEQQIEDLKEWWKDNGTPLIVGAALGLAGFFGWRYWSEQQINSQMNASDLYFTVSEQLDKEEDASQLIKNAKLVKQQYADSNYAVLSAFHLAQQAVKNNQLDQAAEELNWVVEKQPSRVLTNIAKIRLARILIAQQKAQQALDLLNIDKNSGFYELASLVKGDALMALDRKTEALESYIAADTLGKTTSNHSTLKLIIDELTNSELASVKTETESLGNTEAGTDTEIESEKDRSDKGDPEKNGSEITLSEKNNEENKTDINHSTEANTKGSK